MPAPTIIPRETDRATARSGPLARFGRRLLLSQLTRLQDGALTLIEPDGRRHEFGRRTARLDLAVTVEVGWVERGKDYSLTVGENLYNSWQE